jgi:hypothetical protein
MAGELRESILAASHRKLNLILCTSANSGAALASDDFMLSLPPNTIYVSIGKSLRDMEDAGIDIFRLFWIDASGKLPWKSDPSNPASNFSYVENARALSRLSLIITSMSAGGGHSLVVLDSLDALLSANGLKKTLKFSEFLLSQFNSLGMGVLFIARSPKAKGMPALLKPLMRKMDGISHI